MDRRHRDIETLLRLAGEVEAMESPLVGARAVGRRESGRRRLGLLRAGALVGLAVAVVVGVQVWGGRGSGGPMGGAGAGRPVASGEAGGAEAGGGGSTGGVRVEVREVASGDGGEPSVTLAIYRDQDGGVRCVQWRAEDWLSHRAASEIDPATPLGLPSEASCRDGGGHVVMVSLSGPLERLPRSDEGARALAQCIVSSKTAQGWMAGQDPCAAVGTALNCCLPMGVQAQVETVAVR